VLKLPESRSDRIKVLAFIGLGTLGILYAAMEFGIRPALGLRNSRRDRIAELTAQIATAESKADQVKVLRVQNRAALGEILDISERYVLRRRLGNLQLEASEILDGLAADAGVQTRPLRELGVTEIPLAADKRKRGANGAGPAPSTFKIYAAQVDVVGGLHDTVRLLRALETANPYLCVTAISIESQPASPAVHKIALEMQWPIWSDPAAMDELAVQLEALQETGAAASAAETAEKAAHVASAPPPVPEATPAGGAEDAEASADAAETDMSADNQGMSDE